MDGMEFVALVLFMALVSCDTFDASVKLKYIPLSSEKHLIKELLRRYENVTSHGRPVTSVDKPVNVRFGLGLIQMDLDEKARALDLSLWTKMSWEDDYMKWDPQHFNNITSVKMRSCELWMPDVMLYNTAETEISVRDTFLTVFHNGTILWYPHQRMKSSCSIDVTNFPFDTQHCHMWFGSWTYTTKYLNLTMAMPEGMDLSTYSNDFRDSNQWEIVNVEAKRQVLPSSEEEPNYAVLTFTLTLRRNVVFASYILTLPCVFLACLTLVVFWLPPDRPDRTALAMSTFSSFLLLLLILVEAAPPTASSVPRLGIYYCFNMVIIMLAVFLSSLVVNVCRMGEGNSPVPRWLRKITIDSPLNRLSFCESLLPPTWISEYDSQHGRSTNVEMDWISYLPLLRNRSGSMFHQTSANTQSARIPRTPVSSFSHKIYGGSICSTTFTSEETNACHNNNSPLDSPTEYSELVSCMHSLLEVIGNLEERSQKRNKKEHEKYCKRKDWRRVSVILDRMFFLCFLILIVVSILTLFPRA